MGRDLGQRVITSPRRVPAAGAEVRQDWVCLCLFRVSSAICVKGLLLLINSSVALGWQFIVVTDVDKTSSFG